MQTIPILERAIDQRISRLKELNQRSELTEGETTEVDQLRDELTDHQKKLEQRRWMASLEKENAKPQTADFQKAKESYSIRKAILSQLPNNRVDAGREIEVSQELQRQSGKHTDGLWCPVEQTRAVTTTTPSGGPGSEAIGRRHMSSQFINLLRPSTLGDLPFTRLTSKQDISIPKQKATAPTGKFIGETDDITSGDLQLESVTASPTRLGALSSYSTTMLIQSQPSIDQLIANDLSQNLSRILDRVIMYGKNTKVTAGDTRTGYGGSGATWTLADWTGLVGDTDKQFAGILNGIDPITPKGTLTAGKEIDIETIAQLMSELDKEELPTDGRYFILSSALYHKLSTTLEFTSSGSQTIGRNMTVRGYPTKITNLIPANRKKGGATTLSDLIYVHCPSYGLVDFYNGIEIMSNPYSEFGKGIIQVRAMSYMASFKRYSALAEWTNQAVTAL